MIDSLSFEVCDRPTPGLQISVTGDARLLIENRSHRHLFAMVERGYFGVDLLVSPRHRTDILPPIAARLARQIAERDRPTSSPSPISHWVYWFRSALLNSPRTPIHNGEWVIHTGSWFLGSTSDSSATVRLIDSLTLRPNPAAYLSWSNTGSTNIVPLRTLSSSENGRVKSFRRLAREGDLPPVFLLWVSGLLSYVVLDGHDRLVAALLEHVVPRFILLSRSDPECKAAQDNEHVTEYEATMRHLQSSLHQGSDVRAVTRAMSEASKLLAQSVTVRQTHPSWCWQLEGGLDTWQRAATAVDAEWVKEVDPGA